MDRAHAALSRSSSLVHQCARVCPALTVCQCSNSSQCMKKILKRIEETSETHIGRIAFMERSIRQSFSESLTELDDQVRSKNSCNAPLSLLRSSSGKSLSFFTSVELKNPGIASKKSFSELSSPKALIVQSKIQVSISDDSFDAVSLAASSALPDIQRR